MNKRAAMPMTDLGEASHVEVVDRLLDVDGRRFVDMGSGDGGFGRAGGAQGPGD